MKENQVLSEGEVKELLETRPVGYLALAEKDRPYLVPLNFVCLQGNIYFHCGPFGRKVDIITANPRACFHTGLIGEVAASDQPCSFNYHYHSVLVEGSLSEVTGKAEKQEILQKLVEKYTGPGRLNNAMPEEMIEVTRVYCLTPEVISGKKDSAG